MQSNSITREYTETLRQIASERRLDEIKKLVKVSTYWRSLADILQITGSVIAAIASLLCYSASVWGTGVSGIHSIDKWFCYLAGIIGTVGSIFLGWAHGCKKKALEYEEIINNVFKLAGVIDEDHNTDANLGIILEPETQAINDREPEMNADDIATPNADPVANEDAKTPSMPTPVTP
mmetsp:Transcript_5290/g.7805  ORF Transcript_5290/g.7805 Transcript_5290/m.7805 type:complete len:178 (+) Transcript_5290:218-751(+)